MSTRFDGDSEIAATRSRRWDDDPADIANDKMIVSLLGGGGREPPRVFFQRDFRLISTSVQRDKDRLLSSTDR